MLSCFFIRSLFWPLTLGLQHRVIWVKVLLLSRILTATLPATWLLGPPFPICCPGASVRGGGWFPAQASSAVCGVSCLRLVPLPGPAGTAPASGPGYVFAVRHLQPLRLGQAGSIPGAALRTQGPSQAHRPFASLVQGPFWISLIYPQADGCPVLPSPSGSGPSFSSG